MAVMAAELESTNIDQLVNKSTLNATQKVLTRQKQIKVSNFIYSVSCSIIYFVNCEFPMWRSNLLF